MLPANLQSLTPDTLIELFEVSDYNFNNPTETFRFCNYNGVSYRTDPTATPNVYQAIGCESEGFELSGQGPIPQPKITVSNVGRAVSDWLFVLKTNPNYRLEGAEVTRRITQRRFLEGGGDESATARELPPAFFRVEQLSEETFKGVSFVLASPFDLDGATLPGRFALRTCPFRYRGNDCGYTGAAMYDRVNRPVSEPHLDLCNKSLTACELRFSRTYIRFGGYPGLGGF